MVRVGYIFGLSLQTEIMILSFFGIMCTIFDASLLEFNTNLRKIWDTQMDPRIFSGVMEYNIKNALAMIVFVRTFTIHIYLGCYIVMLYPLIFEDRAGLLIPWLVINAIKCLFTGFASLFIGVYLCIRYNFMQPTCWEFLLTHFMEDIPSLYMFCLVLAFYNDLVKLMSISKYIDTTEMKARRRRTRLIIEEHYGVERPKFSRSLDGLIARMEDTAMNDMAAEKLASGRRASISLVPMELLTISSWRDRQTEIVVTQDACTSGAQPLELVLEHNSDSMDFDSGNYIENEKIQCISNLEEAAEQQKPVLVEEATVTDEHGLITEEYRTVSELLNDPNIAIVLNMLTENKDYWKKPEEEDAKLGALAVRSTAVNYILRQDRTLDKVAPVVEVLPLKPKLPQRSSLHTKRLEASVQVSSPSIDAALTEVSYASRILTARQLVSRTCEVKGESQNNLPRPTNAANQPEKVGAITSTSYKRGHLPISANKSLKNDKDDAKSDPVLCNDDRFMDISLQKPRAHWKTYREDGYTQALYENLRLNREQKAAKNS